jgi:soluble cytochrome b562
MAKFAIGMGGRIRSYSQRMKKQLFMFGCAMGLMLQPTIAADKEETPLGKEMETMNDAFKGFRRETDVVKGATQAREAQAAALKCAAEVPAKLKAMPEGPDKAKALAEYRKSIGKLFVTLCEVEEAFLNGKLDEVTKIVETLKETKKTGHDKFMDEEAE